MPNHQPTLKPGETLEFANGYVARSWNAGAPYYAETVDARTGEPTWLSPSFTALADAIAWLESRS